MNRNSGCARGMAVCLCGVLCLSASVFATFTPPPSAQKIMEYVYRRDTNHDITMKASFQVFDQQGHSAKKDFIYRRLGAPADSKTEVVFTAPKEIHGVALLSVDKQGEQELQ